MLREGEDQPAQFLHICLERMITGRPGRLVGKHRAKRRHDEKGAGTCVPAPFLGWINLEGR